MSSFGFSQAQIPRQYLDISVAPDKTDWTYKTGESVEFAVTIAQSGLAVPVDNVRYVVMEEKMSPLRQGSVNLKDGKAKLSKFTMMNPGFLRCEVYATIEGKEYKGLGTAAFEPDKIKPTVKLSSDFQSFWDNAKSELAQIPMDYKMTHLPETGHWTYPEQGKKIEDWLIGKLGKY